MKKYLTYLSISLGGFLYCYNFVVMAGAILFIAPAFALTGTQEGHLISSFVVGALLGASAIGSVVNYLGRKRTLLCIAFFYFFGTCMMITAFSFKFLLAGRVIQGVAGGAATVIGPLYLAEIAPPSQRGFVVSFQQWGGTVGLIFAYGMNYLCSFSGSWRVMIGAAIIPSLLYLIGLLKIPESIHIDTESSSAGKQMFSREYRSSFWILIFLNIFQQITGVNVLLSYAPMIFLAAGIENISVALFSTILIGVVNIFTTLLSQLLIDRMGRRPLLLYSAFGMVLSLMAISYAFWSKDLSLGWIVVGGVVAFTAFFGIGMVSVPGILVSEIFPHVLRGPANSFAALCNWIFNLVIVFTFTGLASYLGYNGVFTLYTLFGVLALIFIWKKVPETVGCILK